MRNQAAATPEDVPESVKDFYSQAYFLADISPKASNALSRYCIQAMIHDFWKLPPRNRGTLDAELRHISPKLSPETKESIEIVQNSGEIGAQLGENVNMMVETTEQEARLLIKLIEVLFDDWYVDRKNRKARCESLREMADSGKRAVKALPAMKAPSQIEPPARKRAKTRGGAEKPSTKSTKA